MAVTFEFIRRHHLLTALLLLSAAAITYAIGFGTGAMVLVVAALALELTGWVLMFSDAPAGRSDR